MRHLLRQFVPALLLTIVFAAGAAAASAQHAVPIKFKKGAYSAVISGRLGNYESQRVYSIKVRAGQRLVLEQLGSRGRPVSIYVTGPDGEPAADMDLSCHSTAVVERTMAGTYRVVVEQCKKADKWNGRFRIRVAAR